MDGLEGLRVLDLTFHPKRLGTLYACTNAGIYKSELGRHVTHARADNMTATLWGAIRSAWFTTWRE